MLSLEGLKTLRPVHRITMLIFLTALVAAFFTMPAFGQPAVHELYYNSSAWVDTNLSALVSGPTVNLGGIAAFNTTPNNQLHVYYLGYDEAERVDHVHQLYFNGSSWSDDDLTALTGGVPGSTEGGLSGFSIGNAQYVYFVGTDFDVHELSYVDNWVDSDLTVLTKGSFGYPYEIASFQTPSNHQRNVFYLGPSKHVHQLLFNGTKWTDQDLTKLTGGENGYGGISAFAIGKKQYVFFESSKKHVEEFLFTSSWVAEDLTVANSLPSVTGTSVAAFAIPGTSKIHVYYNASKSFAVHQLANDTGAWKDENLTALTGGPGGLLTTQTVGFATTPNKQLHVFFPGSPAGDVNQLYYDGTTWVAEDLTVLSGGDQAAGSSGMAAFAIGNLQRLYYVGQ